MGAKIIGATIKLGGEKEFNSAVKSCVASLKNMQSGLKLIDSQNSGQANTLDSLAKRHEALQKVLDASKAKQTALSTALSNAKQDYDRIGQELSQYTDKLDAEKEKLSEIKNIYGESSTEAREQQQVVNALAKTVSQGYDAYQKAGDRVENWSTKLNEAEVEVNQANAALQQNEQYMEEAKASTDKCAKSIDEYGNASKQAADSFDTLVEGASAMTIFENVADAVERIGDSISTVADYVVDVGSTFETATDKVAALSGATSDELDQLSVKAKALGSATQYSASEVMDAFSYMSLAGWSTQQSLSGIDGVLQLAASAEMDLADASDMVTDYLSAFGLKAEDATRVADMLASAQANSNTTATQLGEAYGSCAANLSVAGQSIETVTALLEGMANQGDKGSAAGTQLSAVMAQITAKMKDGAIAIGDTSVQVMDSNGNYRDLIDILTDVDAATEGMGTAQKSAALAATFNRTSLSGLNIILNEGVENISNYRDNLEQADGAASDMANTMQDNLSGKITAMESALEGMGISAYENISGPLTDGVEMITKVVSTATDALEDMPKPLKTAVSAVGLLTVGAGKLAPKIVSVVTTVKQLQTAAEVSKALKAMSAASEADAVAKTAEAVATGEAATATGAFNAVLNANPLILLTTALVAGTVAIAAFSEVVDPASSEVRALSDAAEESANKLDETTSSLHDTLATAEETVSNAQATSSLAQSAIEELIGLQNQTSLTGDEQERQAELVTQLNSLYPELSLSIDETTGKLNMSTDALEAFGDQAEESAKQAAYQEAIKSVYTDMADAIVAQTDAEDDLKDVQQERRRAQQELTQFEEKYGKAIENGQEVITDANGKEIDLLETRKSLMTNVDELKSKEEELNGTLSDATTTIDEAQNKVDEYSTAYNNLTQSTQENTDAVNANASAQSNNIDSCATAYDWYQNMSASQQELAVNFTNSVNTMNANLQSSVSEQLGLFDQLNTGAETSMDEILSGLDSQITGVETWEQNLATLIDMGVNQDLIQTLIDAGPETGSAVQAIVDSGAEGVNQLNEKWALKEQVLACTNDAAEALKTEGAEQIAAGLDGLPELMQESGINTVQGLVDAINEAASEAEAAGEDLGVTTVDGINSGLGTHSPSTKTYSSGVYTYLGLYNAIHSGTSTVRSAGANLGQAAVNGLNSVDGAGSGRTFGYNFSVGLAQGIASGSSGVISAAISVAQSALTATKNTLGEKSPSHITEGYGEFFDEGFILGVENKAKDVTDAVKDTFDLEGALPGTVSYGTSYQSQSQLANMAAAMKIALQEMNLGIVLDGRQLGRALKGMGVAVNG